MQLSLFANPMMLIIRDRLISHHGGIDDARHAPAIDQFILSLISSDTSDKTSGIAFEKLRLHFPRWENILSAEVTIVATVIAGVAHAPVKAKQLITALHKIKAERDTLDLGFLTDWPVADAWSWLQTLPGVGPKVSAATLNFSSLRKPILVVDRHLLRMGKRLGVLPPKADFRRGHRLFNACVPNDWGDRDYYQQHWLMKFHSQTICRAGTPRCGECPLTDICQFFKTYPIVDKM
ncbi:endonuclease III domain-containing protein [Taklimakanibacter deserti]|uniref:endonuclease III domain-containing protein n=1 Tax=Taklimakanibacter deserti TaxID=2267839 RepID=UPI000E65AFBC